MQNAVHTKLTVPEPLEYGWLESRKNYSGITESAVWRNAGSSAYQLQETALKVDTFCLLTLLFSVLSYIRTFQMPPVIALIFVCQFVIGEMKLN